MSGVVRWSRLAFNVAAWLFVAGCSVQVYLAGVGVFSGSRDFSAHLAFSVFGVLTLALIALSLLGRTPRRTVGASILLLVLFAVQSILIQFWRSDPPNPAVAALHPVNGFLIFFVGIWTAWTTRAYLRAPRVQPAANALPAVETKPA